MKNSRLKYFALLMVWLQLPCKAQLLNQRNWRRSEKDSLNKALQFLEDKKMNLALPIFQTILNHYPNEDFLKFNYAKAALNNSEKWNDVYKKLKEVYEKNPTANEINFYLAQAAYNVQDLDNAVIFISNYLSGKKIPNDFKLISQNLKQQINDAIIFYNNATNAKILNFGNLFNSNAQQCFPVINVDASEVFYTAAFSQCSKTVLNLSEQLMLGKIMQIKKLSNESKVPDICKQVIEKENARAACFTADAQSLYMIKENCGQADIFVSNWNNDKFSKAKKIRGLVNSLYNENACSISADGKTLFFSSNRTGGKGGYDLYRATKINDSTFSNVINLGDSINTSADEDSPFMHWDSKTLYFSSKGFKGMGGFDIYKTNFNALDSNFSSPQNLGYPINSTANDLGFVVSANTTQAYMSSDRVGGQGLYDLYYVEPNFNSNTNSLCILRGKITLNNVGIHTNILIQNLNDKNITYTVNSNSSNGNYLAVLPIGFNYQVKASLKNFKEKTINIDLTDMQGYIEKTKIFQFDTKVDSLIFIPTQDILANTTTIRVTTIKEIEETNKSKKELVKESESLHNSFEAYKLLLSKSEEFIAPEHELTFSKKEEEKISFENIQSPGVTLDESELRNTNLVASETIVTKKENENKKAIAKPKDIEKSRLIMQSKADSIINQINKLMASRAKVQGSNVQDSKLEGSNVQSSKLEGSNVQSSNVQSSNVQSSNVQSSNVQSSNVQSSNGNTSEKIVEIPLKSIATEGSKKVKIEKQKFSPQNDYHKKIVEIDNRYGSISQKGLTFRVQIAAYKEKKQRDFSKIRSLGNMEEVIGEDAITRLILGGAYLTYSEAFELAKKIIAKGHNTVYIFGMMDGKRYSVEDLQASGIFK